MFPGLSHFLDFGILLLRLVVAWIFGTSGYRHLKNPQERSKSIGASKAFTIVLGAAELAGALGVAGVLTQAAAFGLILLMLGAIEKKVLVWHTGF
jgi:putative oxidoreductase